MDMMKERGATVEGIFYPETREKLAEAVAGYISSADSVSDSGKTIGLIVPHAGYNYCGEHIGKAFGRAEKKKITTVLLLGPVHRDPEQGIFLTESDLFHTPLGAVKVDQHINEELLSLSTAITRNDIPHLEEHCLEVQLPFIQILYPKAAIVPVLMGEPSVKTITALARALDPLVSRIENEIIIVLSSNASTFSERTAAAESAEMFKGCIENGDSDALIRGVQEGGITSCGAGCAAALFRLTSIRMRGRLVAEGSSEGTPDEKGDRENHVVQYASFELVKDEVR